MNCTTKFPLTAPYLEHGIYGVETYYQLSRRGMVESVTDLLTQQLTRRGTRRAMLYKDDFCSPKGTYSLPVKPTFSLSTFSDFLTLPSESCFPKTALVAKLNISVLQLGHYWLID